MADTVLFVSERDVGTPQKLILSVHHKLADDAVLNDFANPIDN